jgi:hypothetical protein
MNNFVENELESMPRAAEHFAIKLDLEEQMKKLKQKQIEDNYRKREESIKRRKLLLKRLISNTPNNGIRHQKILNKEMVGQVEEMNVNLVEDFQREDEVRYEETIKPHIVEDTISVVYTDRQNVFEFNDSTIKVNEDEVVNFEESKELSKDDKNVFESICRSRYDNIEEVNEFTPAEEEIECPTLEFNEVKEMAEDYNNVNIELDRVHSASDEHIKTEDNEELSTQNKMIVIDFNGIDEEERKKRFNAFKERRMKQSRTKKVLYAMQALEEAIKTFSE